MICPTSWATPKLNYQYRVCYFVIRSGCVTLAGIVTAAVFINKSSCWMVVKGEKTNNEVEEPQRGWRKREAVLAAWRTEKGQIVSVVVSFCSRGRMNESENCVVVDKTVEFSFWTEVAHFCWKLKFPNICDWWVCGGLLFFYWNVILELYCASPRGRLLTGSWCQALDETWFHNHSIKWGKKQTHIVQTFSKGVLWLNSSLF